MVDKIILSQVGGILPTPSSSQAGKTAEANGSFADVLSKASNGVQFSNHAQKRMQVRDIALNDEGINRLTRAVEKAEKRGCQESLILMDDLAFIVNVKDRMIVTALDVEQKGEGVFTQIDSVVLADNG
ncbi:MAG: hypothetical protein JXA25_18300 [Anaerolineales bacterium]|nr:hypothetical protein [Anaerolineales bacterium]